MADNQGFTPNLGTADRLIRVAVGVALFAIWLYMPGLSWGWVLLIPAIYALGTGVLSVCGIYALLGRSTAS